MAVSEKQRLANILNAQKSTGPRSELGKARSRRNSLKHGLTGAGVCLTAEIEHEVEAELLVFARVHKPQDEVERRFVEHAALASVRYNRAQAQSEARTRQRCREAILSHDEKRDAEVEAAMARLDADPAGALAALRRTSEGCDAVEDAWHDLKAILEVAGSWSDHQADRALRLLGQTARPTIDDEPSLAAFWLRVLAARREPDRMKIARFSATMTLDLPDPAEARAALADLADREIDDWKRRGVQLWDGFDAPARADAARATLVDTSAEGLKLHRYQSQAGTQMRQSIKGLESHRKEQVRIEKAGGLPPEGWGRQNEPISSGFLRTQHPTRPSVTSNHPSSSSPAPAGSPTAATPAPASQDPHPAPSGAALGAESDQTSMTR